MLNWTEIIIGLLGGGTIATIITLIATRKKTSAEVDELNIKSVISVNEVLSKRQTDTEVRMSLQDKVINDLRSEILELKDTIRRLTFELEKLEAENRELRRGENNANNST